MNIKQGIVVKVFGLYYAVECGEETINCVLRGKIRQNEDLSVYSDPVAVGDIVEFEPGSDGTGVINDVVERRNIFSRREKGRNKKEDIIASNLDLIVVVQSFKNPKMNLRFVDRLAVRGKKEAIPVLLCLNKKDLAKKDALKYVKAYYSSTDIDICFVSAITGEGMNTLKKYLDNRISLFAGNSGVGKSSILNYLCPSLNLRVCEVSKSTNKGKHTTSNVEMINIYGNTRIIDTPGVREFGLMDIEPEHLGQCFHEFGNYQEKCGFKQCTHDHEPDCEVKRQVESGTVFEDRYISYLNILYSLKDYYENMYD